MDEAVAQLVGASDALPLPLAVGASVREAEAHAEPEAEAHAEGPVKDGVGMTVADGVREGIVLKLRLTVAQAEKEAPACVGVRAVLALGCCVAVGRGPLPEALGEALEVGGLLPLPRVLAVPEGQGVGVERREALLGGDWEGEEEGSPVALGEGVPVLVARALRVLLGLRVVEVVAEAERVSEGRGEVEKVATWVRDARALRDTAPLCVGMAVALVQAVAAAVRVTTVPVAARLPDLLALGQLEAVGLALALGDRETVTVPHRVALGQAVGVPSTLCVPQAVAEKVPRARETLAAAVSVPGAMLGDGRVEDERLERLLQEGLPEALAQEEGLGDCVPERELETEPEADTGAVREGDVAGVAVAVAVAAPPGLRLPPPALTEAQALPEAAPEALPLSVTERDCEGLAVNVAQAVDEVLLMPERVARAVALAQALVLALKEGLEEALVLLVLRRESEALGVRVGCRAVPVGAPGEPLLLPHCVIVGELEGEMLLLAQGQGLTEGVREALPLLLGEPEMQPERLGEEDGVELLQSEKEPLSVPVEDKLAVAQ